MQGVGSFTAGENSFKGVLSSTVRDPWVQDFKRKIERCKEELNEQANGSRVGLLGQ